MNHQTRIGLTDTGMTMLMKISEGNPGALRVLMDCMTQEESIDPDSALAPLGAVLSFDTHGIYGSQIWILYKDVCRENLVDMLGLLRAVQLGFMPESQLISVASGAQITQGTVSEYVRQVKDRLPAFGAPSMVPA